MQFIKKNLANFLTLCNLFFGFAAILNIVIGDVLTGAWLILIAAIFDLSDGFVARLLKIKSSIGKQLDSLSDIVSFGIAPAFLLQRLILESHENWINDLYFTNFPLFSFVPFLLAACAAIRLAKFNIDETQEKIFRGLPTPAAAIFVASLPLIMKYDLYGIGYETLYMDLWFTKTWVIFLITILLSVLMVSGIPLLSMKIKDLKWNSAWPQYILAGIFIVLFIFLHFMAIPLTIIAYIVISVCLKKKITSEVQSI